MLRYMCKRIMQAIPLLFIICVICFTLIQLAPFDAIDTITTPKMPPEVVEALKARHGLDKPAPVQFFIWLRNVFAGNLGYSLVNHQSVQFGLLERLPNTVLLVLPGYTLAIVLAIVLGLFAGSNRGGRLDRAIDAFCSIGMATPSFWVGMMLLYIFAYKLELFPVLGMHTIGKENDLRDLLQHMILPCSVLTMNYLPTTLRFVRSSTISQYREDYVLVQQAFGAGRAQILFRHVMKNVLLPIITLVGVSLPVLITGTFITESIFSWPGVGTYFITAILAFDYPVVMAVMLFAAVMTILGNLLADICYCLVDPRIKSV